MSKTKRRAVCVLLGCLLCLLIFLGIDIHWKQTHRFGIRLRSAEGIEADIQGKQQIAFDPNQLVVNGKYLCPYDKAGERILLAQSIRTAEWTGKLEAANPNQYEIYLLQDALWQDKKAAIGENHGFQIYLISESTYMTSPVVISGGPILSIFGTDDDSISRMQLWNPNSKSPVQELMESYCKFHVRGNASSYLPKQSYKMELCDANGNQVKRSLLDLRDDDDWNLNSLFSDTSKIREKLGYAVWDMICQAEKAPFHSSAVEYTEVLINNEYLGLYGLQLPIDRKLFNMDEDDTAYTFKSYEVPTEEEFYQSLSQEAISGLEQKIGLESGSIADGWQGVEQYLRTFYWERDTASVTLAQVTEMIDLDSFLAYHLAVELLGATDNVLKNIQLLNYTRGGASGKLYKALWDINFSFGDTYVQGKPYFTDMVFPADMLVDYDHDEYVLDYTFLQEIAPKEIHRRNLEKWTFYRSKGIDPETLCSLADMYMQEIQSSGAMARDTERWPTVKNNTDTQKMKTWITERFAFLDAYYAQMAAG